MKWRLMCAASLMAVTLAGSGFAQQEDKLGKVTFPTSCDPKVQAQFERGVAMLHSFWFGTARIRTFEPMVISAPLARKVIFWPSGF